MTHVLKAEGLIKRFKNRLAVNRVSLEVAPGEVVGLLGPNGAGKTTAFKLISGLLPQDGGTVFFGVCLDGLPLYKRARLGLGYLPQGPSVFQGLGVRENLLAITEAIGVASPKKRADELLERFGLESLASQKAKTLSGGERRRLEFARALCSNPKILLCDEPFQGVDPIQQAEIAKTIAELRLSGVGLLITDHSVREALRVCDHVHLIVEGEVVESGSSREIFESPKARRLYLGDGFA